jgi:hypothetical protein
MEVVKYSFRNGFLYFNGWTKARKVMKESATTQNMYSKF